MFYYNMFVLFTCLGTDTNQVNGVFWKLPETASYCKCSLRNVGLWDIVREFNKFTIRLITQYGTFYCR